MSADRDFAALIDRILRCREAEDVAKDDTKEVYADLKAKGYDKTAAGALISELRKKDKNPDKFTERSAMLDLYRDAYDRAKGSLAHTHTREGNEYAAEKGVKITPSSGDVFADLGVERPAEKILEGLREALAVAKGEAEPASIRKANSPSAPSYPAVAENTGAVVSSPAAAPVPNSNSAPSSDPAAEQTGADDLLPSVPVTPLPAARFPTVAGGHPSEPSSDAGAGEQVAVTADMHDAKSERAAPNSPAHGPCEGIARKTPKTEPALDGLAGDLGSTPCKGQNTTPPANHSDGVPAPAKAKEGCLRPGNCRTHFTPVLCSGCANERAKKMVSA